MPHSTHAYPFEARVLAFATGLALRHAGVEKSLVLELTGSGDGARVHTQCPAGEDWHAFTARLDQGGTAYLFYDPFDAEYTWLCWKRMNRATMERLIGQAFVEKEFVPVPGRKAARLDPPGEFPESWGVMF